MSAIDEIHADHNPFAGLLDDAPADGVWWSASEYRLRAAVHQWTNYAYDVQRAWDALQPGSPTRWALADLYQKRDQAAVHGRDDVMVEAQWQIIEMRYHERLRLRHEYERRCALLAEVEAAINRILAGESTPAASERLL